MQTIILLALVGAAMAGNLGYGAGYAGGYGAVAVGHVQPIIGSRPVHVQKTVPVSRPVVNVQHGAVVRHHLQPVVQNIHHPAVTRLVQRPSVVLAKAPKKSGFSFSSEIAHNAAVGHAVAAPVLAVGHGAGLVGHGAGLVGHGAGLVVGHGAGLVGHGAGLVGHGAGLVVGHGAGYGHGGAAALTYAGAGPESHRVVGSFGRSLGGSSHIGRSAAIAVPVGAGHGYGAGVGLGYGAGAIAGPAVGHLAYGAGAAGLGYGVGLLGAAHGGYGHGAIVQKVGVATAPIAVNEPVRVSSYGIETGRIQQATQTHYGTAHIPRVHKQLVQHAPISVHHPAQVVGHSKHVVGHTKTHTGYAAAPIAHVGYGYGH